MQGYNVYTRDITPSYDGPYTTLRDVLEPDVESKYYVPDERVKEWEFLKGAKKLLRYKPNGEPYLYSEGKIPFPDNLDTASRTMLTSEGTLSRSSHLIEDPRTNRYRILTPLECERLNGFPDNWTEGSMTERQRYFCMGNALVVPIVTRMGQTLKDIEEGRF